MTRALLLLVLACGLLGYCVALVPPAMEDQGERNAAIPAGRFRHAPGLSEYNRLVEANP